jgi:hypothetical protein
MISGGISSSNPSFSSIRFQDGSLLNSARNFDDVHVRKRFRASYESIFDQNVTIQGNLTVKGETIIEGGDTTDTTHLTTQINDLYHKIGWDTTLSRWKYTFMSDSDSSTLDYRLQELNFDDYYDKTETDTRIFNSNTAAWEIFSGAGTGNSFTGHSGESYLGIPHTKLVTNNTLIIPHDSTGLSKFVIQNSTYGSGKVLTSDQYGAATWQTPGAVVSVPEVIQTSLGRVETDASFTIHDLTDNYLEFYPNKLSNGYEIAQDGDFVQRVTRGAFSLFVGKGSNITQPTGFRLSNDDGSFTIFGGDGISEGHVWSKTGSTYNGILVGNTIRIDVLGVHLTHAGGKHIHLHGSIQVLPKGINSPHYNKNTEVEVAKLHIGTASSGLGDLVVENKITAKALQITDGVTNTLNKVLTSDENGVATWQNTQATSLVTNFSDDVTMVNLTTSGNLVTHEFTIANAGNTILDPYNPDGIGWNPGGALSNPHPLRFNGQTTSIELGRESVLGSDIMAKHIGQITIPAHYRGNVKIHIPLYVQHQYNYKWRQNQSQYNNQPTNETAFHFFLSRVEVLWRDDSTMQVWQHHVYSEDTPYEDHQRTLGSVYIQHHRNVSKSSVDQNFFPYLHQEKWKLENVHFPPGTDRILKEGDKIVHKYICHLHGNLNNCSTTHGHRGSSHPDFFDNDGTHTYHQIVEIEDLQVRFSPPVHSTSKSYSLELRVRIGYLQQGPSLYNGSFSYANTLAQRYPHMTLSFGDVQPYLINWWRWGSPTEGHIHIKDISTGRFVTQSLPYWTLDTSQYILRAPYPLLPYFNLKRYPASTPQFGVKDHNDELWNINRKKYVAFIAWNDSNIISESFRNNNNRRPIYDHIHSTSLEDGGYQPYHRVISYMKILHHNTIDIVHIRGAYSYSNTNVEIVPEDLHWHPKNNLEGYAYQYADSGGIQTHIRVLQLITPVPTVIPDNWNPVYLVRFNSRSMGVINYTWELSTLKQLIHFGNNLRIEQFPRSPYFGFEEYRYVPPVPEHTPLDLFPHPHMISNQFMNPDAHPRHLQLGSLYVSKLQADTIDTPSPIVCRGIHTRSSSKVTPLLNELANVQQVITWNYNLSYLETYINDQLVYSVPPNYSDHRLKIDIRYGCPTEDVLDKLCDLPLFQYSRLPLLDKEEQTHNHFGFYAHEIQSLFPEIPHLVRGKKDDSNYQTINYDQLTIILIQSIKELRSEIQKVKKDLKKMKDSLFTIQSGITFLLLFFFFLYWIFSCRHLFPLLTSFFSSCPHPHVPPPHH